LIQGASTVVKGKTDFLELLVAAALAQGHVLLEDRPGVGKTTVAKTFARLVGTAHGAPLSFKRIQFTPDLLPYDITGVDIFDPETRSFRFVPGPIFANIILADEINRTTPKVQSALLEVMAEGQVTVGNITHQQPTPFMVIATQNPMESEGTFLLPIAQLDRFMLRISIGYPDRETELAIITEDPSAQALNRLGPVIDVEDLKAAQNAVLDVYAHPELIGAIADIIRETRNHKDILLGASPRAGLHFLKALKALAFVKGRKYAIDEDILRIAGPVLAHRIKLRDPRHHGETIIREIALERINGINK
jgi:MoxR-like ATPase